LLAFPLFVNTMPPMKKVIISAVFLTVALGVFATSIHAMSSKPKEKVPFEETAGYKKIDLRLRDGWQSSNDNNVFECILKTTEKADAKQKEALQNAGFKTRTFIGKIVTGSMKRGDLYTVANLDFVEAIELAVPLSLKKK